MKKKPIANIPRYGILAIMLILSSCLDNSEVTPADDLADLSTSATSTQQTFAAKLLGSNERPTPVETDGKGQAIFKLSKDGMSLSYKIIVHNIENVTQAHIHCGDANTAGPVVAFLFGFIAEGVTVNGVLAEGVITSANIIPRPDSNECMGGVANFDQLIAKLKTGDAYINVHTLAYPPGEIRGQIH